MNKVKTTPKAILIGGDSNGEVLNIAVSAEAMKRGIAHSDLLPEIRKTAKEVTDFDLPEEAAILYTENYKLRGSIGTEENPVFIYTLVDLNDHAFSLRVIELMAHQVANGKWGN